MLPDRSVVEPQVNLTWNQAVNEQLKRDLGFIVRDLVEYVLARRLERQMAADLGAKVNERVKKALDEAGLPDEVRRHVVADVVPDGLRVRVLRVEPTVHEVRLSGISFTPQPWMGASVTHTDGRVHFNLVADAKEGKDRGDGKDGNPAAGDRQVPLFVAGPGAKIVAVLGRTSWESLREELADRDDPGHGRFTLRDNRLHFESACKLYVVTVPR